jgi:hypothetical protein
MRSEHEWLDFQARVTAASARYVTTGEPEQVAPRDGIMVPTPERRASTVKQDVDGRVPNRVALHSAEATLRYRPLDYVARLAPRALLLISVEHDAVTPEDHARALYDAAGDPRCLLVQTGTTHYAAYAQYRDLVNPRIVAWFARYLVSGDIEVHSSGVTADGGARTELGVRYLDRPAERPAEAADGTTAAA